MIDQTIVPGTIFGPTPPHTVTDDGMARFAAALGGAGADGVPATYPIVVSLQALTAAMGELGVELTDLVHRDQRFVCERPVRRGDVLRAVASVTRRDRLGSSDIVTLDVDVRDARGARVCVATSTVVARSEEPAP